MMPEGIGDASQAPAIRLVVDWRDRRSSGRDRLRKRRIGIVDYQHHPHRGPTQRFRTEIEVLRRFVGDPEFRRPHRQLRHHGPVWGFDPEQLPRSERRLVKLDRPRPFANESIGASDGLGFVTVCDSSAMRLSLWRVPDILPCRRQWGTRRRSRDMPGFMYGALFTVETLLATSLRKLLDHFLTH
jgi:hypothetical protein